MTSCRGGSWEGWLMPENLPTTLKLEVKTSRTTSHQLSPRDLDGIGPDGFVAVLITERLQRGPRWILVPGDQLQAGTHTDSGLCKGAEKIQPELCSKLNGFWSDWILDGTVWEKLFEQEHIKIKAGIEWCLQHHPPRINQSTGALREIRLASAIQNFRSALDERVSKESGPKQEGFIHQYLLVHALELLGYSATVNPVGVPDINATLGAGKSAAGLSLQEKIFRWNPADKATRDMRDQLLTAPVEALDALRKILSDD